MERDGRRLTIEATPVYDDDIEGQPARTRLGFVMVAVGPARPAAVRRGARDLRRQVLVHHEGHARAAGSADRRRAAQGDLAAWSGSYEVTRQTILTDVDEVIGILAIISLSLAIINLFPFLPLDGGHIFWAIVEKVRRKPVPFSVMERAGVIGFMLVIFIFLIGLTNDIDRLQGEGFGVR